MKTIWKSVAALVIGVLIMVLGASPAQAFWGTKQRLFGQLTTVQVPCDTLCTTGPLTGGLAGQLDFTMDVMEDTDDPEVVRYDGTNTITMEDGTLSGSDYGYWNLTTGEFYDYTFFTVGTGAYAGKFGWLVIVGAFDPVTGVGASNYYAVLF